MVDMVIMSFLMSKSLPGSQKQKLQTSHWVRFMTNHSSCDYYSLDIAISLALRLLPLVRLANILGVDFDRLLQASRPVALYGTHEYLEAWTDVVERQLCYARKELWDGIENE